MGTSNRSKFKEKIAVTAKYDAFYTGGPVQITQDGNSMLCCYGNCLKVVDIASGKIVDTTSGEEYDELTSFILGDDDTTLVASGKNGILIQWNFKEKTKIKSWKSAHNGPVACMALDSTSTLLASGGSDSTVKVWDVTRQYYTHNLRGGQGVFSIVCFYKSDSDLFVFGAAADYKIRAWNLDSKKSTMILEGHYSTVTSLQFCKKRNIMLSGGRDKVVLVWNLENFSLLKTIPVYESIEAVIMIPEGRSLPELGMNTDGINFITAGSKGILKVWDGSTGRCIHTQDNSMTSVSEDDQVIASRALYSKNLDAIAIVTFEHNIIFYKLEDFSLIKQFVGYNDEILDIKFMGKKETHLAVATNSPLIRIYDIATFACQLLEGHQDLVVALDVFPKDRNILISGSKDNSVFVWQMDSGTGNVQCMYMGFGHTRSVSAVACSRERCSFLLSASDDTTLKVWDIPAKKPVVALKVHLPVRCTVKAHDKTINSICVSVNDKLVATGSQDHTAKIWNAKDLTLAGTVKGHKKGVMCVQFSPVDQVLATASKDGMIKIWHLKDFTTLRVFEGHGCAVQNIVFLNSGLQFLSSSCNGVIMLWNIKQSECVQSVSEHEGEVWALTADMKEDTFVSGGADSSIIVWKDTTEQKQKEEFEMHKSQIIRLQQLENLVHEKRWVEALGLAITLEQPFRTLKMVKAILGEDEGRTKLHDTIAQLRDDQIENLLKYVVEWNTQSKFKKISILILYSVVKIKSPDELEKFANFGSIIRPLLPHTESFSGKCSTVSRETPVVDLLWKIVKVAAVNDECLNNH